MSAMLVAAIALGLCGFGSSMYVWIRCASIDAAPAVVMCALTAAIYGVLVFLGVFISVRKRKPFYIVPAAIIFVLGVLLFLARDIVFDIIEAVYRPIGPGSLPGDWID